MACTFALVGVRFPLSKSMMVFRLISASPALAHPNATPDRAPADPNRQSLEVVMWNDHRNENQRQEWPNRLRHHRRTGDVF
jgi:hypothetical protein